MAINYTALASGTLAFTLALAWNDAVSRTVKSLVRPTDESGVARVAIAYAIVVTVLVIVIVATINHARRIVHWASQAGKEVREAGPVAKPPTRKSAGAEHDCKECAKNCGFKPLVQLWEP